MTGLVGYGSSGSSDEEDFSNNDRRLQLDSQTPQQSALSVSGVQRLPTDNARKEPTVAPAEDDSARPSEARLGPPSHAMIPEGSALSAPSSPHTDHRAAVRSLTLPVIPNLDIPQSPLGSLEPGADQKFSHFLELKKQGIHFNIKLASSSALKNPSLLPKLMAFAGVGSEEQYTSILPTELWDPAVFHTWAYKEDLAEVQHGLVEKKGEERPKHQRESIEFVGASAPGKNISLIGPKGSRASAAKRAAVLDKDTKSSPHLNTIGVRNEVDRRERTNYGLQAGGVVTSPRRRKRSQSR